MKKKKFKMIYVYLILIVSVFVLIAVMNNNEPVNALYQKQVSDLNTATRALLSDPNYQNIILPDELDQKIANKEDFFVYFFASDCQHCKNTTPQLMPIAEELGINLPQFNLREFESYFNKHQIEYTPTLVYFQDGVQVQERMEGGLREQGTSVGYSTEDYKNYFNKYTGTGS